MKNLFCILKSAVVCFLIYKSLFYAFLFLIAGMWLVTTLLIILCGYLCKTLFTDVVKLNIIYKSFQHFDWKEKLIRIKPAPKLTKQFSSETA